MADTNYIGSMVKILEKPIQKVFNDKISVTEVRVQLPQPRNTTIVNLIFWGNLAHDVNNYYKINDYIIIEGYLSFNKINRSKINQKLKKVEITVFKIYPFRLNSNS